ncbi:hypothetical protein J0H58_25570 [bacterium]|nr:hypothetical protein [bacterium]
MRFRYLRDPLFVACVAVYLVNRFVLKPAWEVEFVHAHLNDLICVPFWVPVMLWGERRLGLRSHDGPPEPVEIIIPLVLWAWVFEVILPRTAAFGRYCVADHRDVLYYAAGALGGAVFWRWWYGAAETGTAAPETAGP